MSGIIRWICSICAATTYRPEWRGKFLICEKCAEKYPLRGEKKDDHKV